MPRSEPQTTARCPAGHDEGTGAVPGGDRPWTRNPLEAGGRACRAAALAAALSGSVLQRRRRVASISGMNPGESQVYRGAVEGRPPTLGPPLPLAS